MNRQEDSALAPASKIATLKNRKIIVAERMEILFVISLCGLFSYLRWLKMDSLVSSDPARWLFEASRFTNGELPYRDFSWQYPPFSIVLYGITMRIFGARFVVAQVLTDLISWTIILLVLVLARKILPLSWRLTTVFMTIAVCATSLTKFNLFSFLTYVPALQTGVIGCLMVLISAINYIRTGVLRSAVLPMSVGTFIAFMSKPEALLGTLALLVILGAVDRVYWFRTQATRAWLQAYGFLLAVCIGPAGLAYLLLGVFVGPANLASGISGYGLASESCPWWPTGLGIFGITAALGQSLALLTVLSIFAPKDYSARFGKYYIGFVCAGMFGFALYVTYVFYLNPYLVSGSQPFFHRLLGTARTTLMSNAVLIPVMWTSVICWIVSIIRIVIAISRRSLTGRDLAVVSESTFEFVVILTIPVTMATRGLFDTTLDRITEVPAICYPFFLVLGPFLLCRLLMISSKRCDLEHVARIQSWVCISLLIVYAVIRIAGGYATLLSNAPYRRLSTVAGDIWLTAYATNAEIYRFVMQYTSDSDTILDIPYGGGINFATRRASPVFTTQFKHLRMPEKFRLDDFRRAARHPPRVVIVQDAENYGAFYGLEGTSCAFPTIVWSPLHAKRDPSVKFPLIQFIQSNYLVAEKVGRKLLLVPKWRE